MRRKYFGLVIAAIATLGSVQAWAGDREIAEQIIERLKKNRESGSLADFTLDLKVDKGVVLFRGNVAQQDQKNLVFKAADGIDGIAQIIDEIDVDGPQDLVEIPAQVARAIPDANSQESESVVTAGDNLVPTSVENAFQETMTPEKELSLRQALAAQARAIMSEVAADSVEPVPQQEVVPGEVRATAAMEPATPVDRDQQVVADVVSALGRAKNEGMLKGFGVDVKCQDGIVQLRGRASSADQRNQILQIARSVAGTSDIRESISIPSELPSLPRLPEPPVLRDPSVQGSPASNRLVATPQTIRPQPQSGRTAQYQGAMQSVQARPAVQSRPAIQAQPTSYSGMMGAPVVGQPVPMAPYSGVAGAPRYDSPQLPNYAWPGYASHPNYAALTYPQQYSPTAWPYIGPFYPYPQVPLGWRKVSLEWDDGWWHLDFTDRH